MTKQNTALLGAGILVPTPVASEMGFGAGIGGMVFPLRCIQGELNAVISRFLSKGFVALRWNGSFFCSCRIRGRQSLSCCRSMYVWTLRCLGRIRGVARPHCHSSTWWFMGLQWMILAGLVFPQFSEAASSTFRFNSEPPGIVGQSFFQRQDLALPLPLAGLEGAAPFLKAIEEPRARRTSPPRSVTAHIVINICDRTGKVRDAILRLIPNQNDCRQVSSAQLAGITGILDLGYQGITSLQPGDFDGLIGLEALSLGDNSLSTLPVGIFDDLASLKILYLWGNSLETLPDGALRQLTSLTWLYLDQNKLQTLPDGIFSGLTSLTVLDLNGNQLGTLPDGVFDGLTSLESLDLSRNELTVLGGGVFDGLTSIEVLRLEDNFLGTFPDGIFDELTSLERLDLGGNSLSTLSDGVFDQLGVLESLDLRGNKLDALSGEVFDGLVSLETLYLSENMIRLLSGDVFDELTSLEMLGLWENSLHVLPAGVFDQLVRLNGLSLADNSLGAFPDDIFENMTMLPVSTLNSEGDFYDYPGLFLGGNPGTPFQPVIDAGSDQSVAPGAMVSLQGQVTGPWGDHVRWGWMQVDGANSDIPVDASQAIRLTGGDFPNFTAPMAAGAYHFKAVGIPAGAGNPTELWGHANSAPDWVTVYVDRSTGVADTPGVVDFALRGNYPNPFNRSTRILVDLPEPAAISVELFNLLGQRVYQADLMMVEAGPFRSPILEVAGLPSGMYVYKVTARMGAGVQIATGHMTLIK